MTTDELDPNTAKIIDRLLANGWQRTASSEALDWANLVYDAPRSELEVDYMPTESSLDFQCVREDGEWELLIEFDDRLDTLLDLIVESQETLGSATWDAFVERLLRHFPHTSAVLGEEEDDIVPLRPEG